MENSAALQDNVQEVVNFKAAEIVKLKAILDQVVKGMYDRLDTLTMDLKTLVGPECEVFVPIEQMTTIEGKLVIAPPQFVKIVDNFATKNVAFKAAAVRRYDVSVEGVEEKNQRLAKEAKKALKK